MPKKNLKIGLIDADLLCNVTRHPNLALLKIAGFFRDNGFVRGITDDANSYELITNENNFDDLQKYDYFYVSCVFTFTIDDPPLVLTTLLNDKKLSKRVRMGGTGTYANLSVEEGFAEKREEDMHKLEKDAFLNKLKNKSGGFGIDMQRQMPDYHLYDGYVSVMENVKSSDAFYKDYKEYSIGFLTRGCFRRCPFCVNKLERKAMPYSKLSDFLDNEIDETTGKLKRPYIYLWDDNFLLYKNWKDLLQKLIDRGKPFQFRQGLDERMLAESPNGREMAEMLSHARYHGDFIFAFDNWRDRGTIEKALKIWKHYNPKKGTKFYLFCGFRLTEHSHERFYNDIWELFQRIRILMSYGCVGYVMRHEDYHKYEISNLYIQVARWCNQQQFYKKMSFWEFAYRNQSYWEEHSLHVTDRPHLKTFEEFLQDLKNGYYGDGEGQVKMCLPLQSVMRTLEKFPQHREELLEMFNYKMSNLLNPKLWESYK